MKERDTYEREREREREREDSDIANSLPQKKKKKKKKKKDQINMLLETQNQVRQDIFLQNFTKYSGWNFIAKLGTES